MTKEAFESSITTIAEAPVTADERLVTVDGQANVLYNRGLQDTLDNASGGGLDQTAVDGRINTLIPSKQRVPAYAAHDAGEVLTVASDGNSIGFNPLPHSMTLAQRTAAPGSLDTTNNFTVGDIINIDGVLYELVSSNEDNNVLRGTIAADAGGQTGYFGDDAFRWQTVSPYNMLLMADQVPLGHSPPDNLWVKFHSGTEYADIKLARAAARDTGLFPSGKFAYVHAPGTPGLNSNTVGATYDLTVFSNDAYTTPQSMHSLNRWERDDRNDPDVNPIALNGNTDRWTKAKLPSDTAYQADLPSVTPSITLLTRNPGLTLTSTTPDFNVGQAPYYWANPGIDLDDHPHGEFHCSLELTIAPVSDVNMGFVRNKANQTAADRNVALSNIVFASDLADEDDVVVSSAISGLNGLNIFRQTVYSANTIVGHYNIMLTHNANNEVGYHVYWDGEAGATGATLTAELRVTFTPSDASTIPAKNSRGALQATSSILPTTGLVNGRVISGVSWTLPMGSGLTVDGVTLTEAAMRVVPGQIGWWVVVEVNGVETYETLDAMNNSGTIIIRAGQSDAKFLFQTTSVNKWRLAGGNSPTLPANTRVKIYLAVT